MGREGFQPLVVEAQAVDHALVLGQAEQARARVARLRQGRDRAAFHETEARGQHCVGNLGVLVEAGGQAHAGGQLHAAQLHRQARIVEPIVTGPQPCLQCADDHAVGVFGIEDVKGAGGGVLEQTQASDPSWGAPSASRGAGVTARARAGSSAP